ncbi:hypothetical protein Tco_0949905 [Tanacetum coccineum]
MDPMISLGQKNTLAEYMILSGADNRPPMLDKDLYDSWKSRMELYMQNREHGRMILESVEHGPLIWPTVEENGLLADIYSLVNHHRVAKDLWERVQLLMQGFAVSVFSPGDDPIACLNKAMAFLMAVASLRQELLMLPLPRCKGHLVANALQPKRPRNAAIGIGEEKAMLAEAQEAGQILEEEQLAFLADPGVPASQAQDINSLQYIEAQQDSMILSVIEQMSEQMINHVNNWEKANKEQNNESITTELERYKEKLALKEQIESLEQNLSKQIKEKESLFKTFTFFKMNPRKGKYILWKMKLLGKEIKELDNIICKAGQSAQTVHMLTKPQAFYDKTHKQALGYQNPFYLKKAQRITTNLVMMVVFYLITHVAMPVIDDEETLILEEKSRPKMLEKAKDPEVVAKKISHKPIDYGKLNSLINDFGKRFSPRQEFLAERAFWFPILNPTIKPSYTSPVIVDVPSELPKLKFHLTQFDSMVKKRTTPSALEEGKWGFKHTKAVFNKEIIPFLKSFKDIFNVFDKDLLNEITEVQIVFDQIEASVQQFSIDKKCLEVAKKEILLENDRLLQKIMSQYVMLTVINSVSWNNDSVNMKTQMCDSCEKCMNLDTELSKSKQAYNDLLKNNSQLEKHCISLELSMQLKQEVFQNDESYVNQNVVEIQEYFEINDLKARLQDKHTTISKLKDTIKSLEKNTKEKNVHHEKCDLEPINEELENSVAKLLSENEQLWNEINHVKQVFKDQFDSIKQARVRHKEQFKQAKAKQPLDGDLDLACKYTIRIQELLVYVQDMCPNAITPSSKKIVGTPRNNVKKVRFAEPITSSSKTQQVESSKTSDSNTHVLSSIGVKCSTSNCGSKPQGNKRNDRISQTPSRNKMNKVEAQPRKVN